MSFCHEDVSRNYKEFCQSESIRLRFRHNCSDGKAGSFTNDSNSGGTCMGLWLDTKRCTWSRSTTEESFSAHILVDIFPMDPIARTGDCPVFSLGLRRVEKTRKPGQR